MPSTYAASTVATSSAAVSPILRNASPHSLASANRPAVRWAIASDRSSGALRSALAASVNDSARLCSSASAVQAYPLCAPSGASNAVAARAHAKLG